MNKNIIREGNDFMVDGDMKNAVEAFERIRIGNINVGDFETISTAIQQSQRYKTALQRLLACPDLNHDSLDDETIVAIYEAHKVLGE